MTVRKRLFAGLAFGLALAFAGTGLVRANSIIVSLGSGISGSGGAPTFSAGVWTYTYDIAETTDSEVHSGGATSAGGTVAQSQGDFFGIIDIPGYIVGSAKNISLTTAGGGSWTETDSLLGFQPDTGTIVPDSGSLENVNFQYVGTDNGNFGPQTLKGSSLSADPSVPADGFLGLISIQSTLSPAGSAVDPYQGQDFNQSTLKDQSNQSFVNGPSSPNPTGVPEPSTAMLLPMTVLALGCVLSYRHARA
jgi:hypothetical protein